jgi:hypothetical protein
MWPKTKTTTDRSAWWLAVAGAIGIVTGAVGGAAVTGMFNHIDHASDLDAKMIQLTVSILRSKPDAETMPLRTWAIDTLQRRARFKFTDQQIAVLENQKLPGDDSYYSDGSYDDGGRPAIKQTKPVKLPPGARLEPN